MARPKPRRPKPGRGLPPPRRLTPEAAAEEDRLRAELARRLARLEAMTARKAELARQGVRVFVAGQY